MKIEKAEKLAANLHDKTEYVISIRNLKQAFSHSLVFKKVHRVIKFNQNAWLKPCIDTNTDLGKNSKEKTLRKTFSSWWIMQALKKRWKMWQKAEILNLSQQKEEGII